MTVHCTGKITAPDDKSPGTMVSICGKARSSYGLFTLIQLKPERRGEGSAKVSLHPHPNWKKFAKPLSERVYDLRLSQTLGIQWLRGEKPV